MTAPEHGPADLLQQLTDYLTGPGKQRLPWQRHNPPTGPPYWTAQDRYGGTWSVRPPDPGRAATLPYTLRTALGTLAAAERRPIAEVAADIATTGGGTPHPRPASSAARLTGTWDAAAPRHRAPQIVFQPAPPANLDTAVSEVFTAGFHHGWYHRVHRLLSDEATTTLKQAQRAGPPPAGPDPTLAQLHEEITLASAEHYLASHGWKPLDATPTVRRWHHDNPGTHIIELPTSNQQRTRMLNTAAATIATVEGRSPRQVLADLGEPLLRNRRLARIHDLLLHPPTPTTAQVTAALDHQTLTTATGHQQPLRNFAHQQVDLLGATDAVWHAGAQAGAAAATERLTRLLTTPPAATSDPPARTFVNHPTDPPPQVAAAIWAAGSHLPPAAHARWFARTWWPYHVTATTRTTATHLANELDLNRHPIDIPPARGGPNGDLLRRAEKTAHPHGDSRSRFIAAYRLLDTAARHSAVPLAVASISSRLPEDPDQATEPTAAALAREAADPRQFNHPPSDRVLGEALAQLLPDPQPPAAGRPPPGAAFPPPWRALLSTSPTRSTGPPADQTLINPASVHRQHQLRHQQVIEAAAAIARTTGGTHAR